MSKVESKKFIGRLHDQNSLRVPTTTRFEIYELISEKFVGLQE